MALMATSPSGLAGSKTDRGYIAARVAVDYLAPVSFGPGLTLRVETWVGRVGTSSWTLLAELFDGDAVAARCECVIVAYSYAAAPLPAARPRRAAILGGVVQVVRYVYDCTLRWSDLDAYGHVNNARFLTLFEEARVDLFFAGGRAWGLRPSRTVWSSAGTRSTTCARSTTAAGQDGRRGRPTSGSSCGWRRSGRAGSPSPTSSTATCWRSRARSVLVPFDLTRQLPRADHRRSGPSCAEWVEADRTRSGRDAGRGAGGRRARSWPGWSGSTRAALVRLRPAGAPGVAELWARLPWRARGPDGRRPLGAGMSRWPRPSCCAELRAAAVPRCPPRRDAAWRWPLPRAAQPVGGALPAAEVPPIAVAAAGTLRTAATEGVAGRRGRPAGAAGRAARPCGHRGDQRGRHPGRGAAAAGPGAGPDGLPRQARRSCHAR